MVFKNVKQYNYDNLVEFIRLHQDDFYRLAYSYVKNSDNAMDIVQDAIVKGLTKVDSLKNSEAIKPWFYKILVNECLIFIRKNKRIYFLEDISVEEPSVEAKQVEDSIVIYNSIQKLNEKEKTVIILRYFEDMKISDIARVISCNENTVKTRLYKALKKLENILGEEN